MQYLCNSDDIIPDLNTANQKPIHYNQYHRSPRVSGLFKLLFHGTAWMLKNTPHSLRCRHVMQREPSNEPWGCASSYVVLLWRITPKVRFSLMPGNIIRSGLCICQCIKQLKAPLLLFSNVWPGFHHNTYGENAFPQTSMTRYCDFQFIS